MAQAAVTEHWQCKSVFFRKKKLHLLVMPIYWGEQIFSLGVSRSGSKAKDVEERRVKDLKLVITMASYALQTPPRVAHSSCLGQKNILVKDAKIFVFHEFSGLHEGFTSWHNRDGR